MLGILRPASLVQFRTSIYTGDAKVMSLRLLEIDVAACRKPGVEVQCMLLG